MVRQLYKLPLCQILYQIKRANETKQLMEDMLMERAERQECLEVGYNDLVTLAGKEIELLSQIEEGETLTDEWVAQSHQLAACTLDLIENGTPPPSACTS